MFGQWTVTGGCLNIVIVIVIVIQVPLLKLGYNMEYRGRTESKIIKFYKVFCTLIYDNIINEIYFNSFQLL